MSQTISSTGNMVFWSGTTVIGVTSKETPDGCRLRISISVSHRSEFPPKHHHSADDPTSERKTHKNPQTSHHRPKNTQKTTNTTSQPTRETPIIKNTFPIQEEYISPSPNQSKLLLTRLTFQIALHSFYPLTGNRNDKVLAPLLAVLFLAGAIEAFADGDGGDVVELVDAARNQLVSMYVHGVGKGM
jgi:hypothetical protein